MDKALSLTIHRYLQAVRPSPLWNPVLNPSIALSPNLRGSRWITPMSCSSFSRITASVNWNKSRVLGAGKRNVDNACLLKRIIPVEEDEHKGVFGVCD